MHLVLRILFPVTLAALAAYVGGVYMVPDLRPHGVPLAVGILLLGAPFAALARGLWMWEGTSRRMWLYVLTGAVLLRAPLLFVAPSLSDDVYRYAWDGRQQVHGMNPYRHAPDAPEVEHLRDPLWERVNNKDVPTIYPPLAQMLFAATDAVQHSARAYKVLVILFDLALIVALGALCEARGVPRARVALYAWHPLVLLELAGQAHNDSLPLFFLVLGLVLAERGRGRASMLALAASTATKFFGGVAAPLVALRTKPAAWVFFPAALALLYLPYAGAGAGLFAGVGTYAAHWEFNHGIFRVADLALRVLGMADPRLLLKAVFGLGGVGLLGWLMVRKADPVRGTLVLIAYAMLVSPTVHPWYVIWCIPLLVIVPSRGLLCWSFTAAFAYHVMPAWAADGVWQENLWWTAAEYLPVLVLLAIDARSLTCSAQAPADSQAV